VGEGFLQLWADAIVSKATLYFFIFSQLQTQPSAGANYDNPGLDLGRMIIERREEISKEKETMKASRKARKSLQHAINTPSHYSRNPFRTPIRIHPLKFTSPGPSTSKRSADNAGLDGDSDGGATYPSLEEWLGRLDQIPGRRMQDFQFLSLLEGFTAEGIDNLEVLNELGKEGLKNDFGLSLGHAIKLAKWAQEDVKKLLN
jgi:hypothetical protein